jgi:hypothetical protein
MAGLDSNTKLLLHMDDVGLTDSSFGVHSIAKNGAVTRSNAQSKFGGYSAYSDGNADWLGISDNADWDFGTGDFTVDFWVYLINVVEYVYFLHSALSGQIRISYEQSAKYLYIHCGTVRTNFPQSVLNFSTWYHIAVVRNSGNLKLYVNGNAVDGGQSSSGSILPSALTIGHNSASAVNGYLDEYRISNTARWTSNFTPPEAAYDEIYGTIEGTLSDDSYIYVIKENTNTIEQDGVYSAGAYYIGVGDLNEKTVVAVRQSDGQILGYGRVIPVEI